MPKILRFWVEIWRLPLFCSWILVHLPCCLSHGLVPPTNGIIALVRLGGEWESNYRRWELTLMVDGLQVWVGLSHTSFINGYNIGFIREVIHIINALRFLVEIWRLPLLWSWSIFLVFSLVTFELLGSQI